MQTKNIFQLLSIALCFFILSSCNRYGNYYLNENELSNDANIPVNQANILMLQKKGDAKLNYDYNNTGSQSIQLGYSPIKHLSVSGEYFNTKVGSDYYGNFGVISNQGHFFSGSIGGYYFLEMEPVTKRLKIDKEKNDKPEGILFDLYTGYGEGILDTEMSFYNFSTGGNFPGRISTEYQKYFIQPGIHIQQQIFSMSYVLNITHFNLYQANAISNAGVEPFVDLQYLEEKNPINYYEHTFMLKAGNRLFDIVMTATIPKSRKANFRQDIRGYSSIGLTLNLDEFYKRVAKKKSKK